VRDITYSILSDDEAALNEAVRRLEEALRGEPLLSGVSAEAPCPGPSSRSRRGRGGRAAGRHHGGHRPAVRVATIGDFDRRWPRCRSTPAGAGAGRAVGAVREDLARIGALRVPTARAARCR
jgi:hypothetical protein